MASTIKLINVGFRVPLFMFLVIALGLTAHLRSETYHLSRNNLGIAASSIGLFFSILLAVPYLFLDSVFNLIPLMIVDFISFALLLSAAASLTPKRWLCHRLGYCGELRAAIAFLYMSWILLFFILLLEAYELFVDGAGSSSSRSGGFTGRTRFTRANGHYSSGGLGATGATGASGYAKEGFVDQQAAAPGEQYQTTAGGSAPNESANANYQTTVGGTYPTQP